MLVLIVPRWRNSRGEIQGGNDPNPETETETEIEVDFRLTALHEGCRRLNLDLALGLAWWLGSGLLVSWLG